MLPGPPDNSARFEVYYSDFVNEKDKTNYKKLSQFGFIKIKIGNDFSDKIDIFFTGQPPLWIKQDYVLPYDVVFLFNIINYK